MIMIGSQSVSVHCSYSSPLQCNRLKRLKQIKCMDLIEDKTNISTTLKIQKSGQCSFKEINDSSFHSLFSYC